MKKFILIVALAVSSGILFGNEQITLSTPNFSEDQFVDYGVGIRPARKGDLRLEVQTLAGKTVIHNYGHGGAGISLSFGCSQVVTELVEECEKNSVAVLGSGIIGLTAANDLLDRGFQVTIYSADFPPYTTSNVGTGIWEPFLLSDPDDLVRTLGTVAYQRFQALADNDFPEFEGVSRINVYSFGVSEERKSHLPNPVDVEVSFDHHVTHEGVNWQTFRIDGDLFMQDLLEKVVLKGAKCIKRAFNSKDELLELEEPILINCMGYGAKTVFNDNLLIPIRGQLLYFAPQTNIDYVLGSVGDRNNYFYFVPWENKLILGGTYEVGEEACTIDKETCHRIWNNALNYFKDSESN